jgi:hypothetical protein
MFITFRSNPSIYFWFFQRLSLPRTISGSLPFCILFILFSIQLLFYLRLLYVQVVLIQLLLEMSRSVHLTVRLNTEASAHRTPTCTRHSENFTTHIKRGKINCTGPPGSQFAVDQDILRCTAAAAVPRHATTRTLHMLLPFSLSLLVNGPRLAVKTQNTHVKTKRVDYYATTNDQRV